MIICNVETVNECVCTWRYMGCYVLPPLWLFWASLSLFVRGGGVFGVGRFSFCSGQPSFLFTHTFVFAISTTPKLFPSPRIDHDLVKMFVIQTGTNDYQHTPQKATSQFEIETIHTTTTTTSTASPSSDTLTRYCLKNPRAPSLQTTST